MEGTNPPLLKGAGLSPSAILLSNPGLPRSSRVGGSQMVALGKGPWAERRASPWGNCGPAEVPPDPSV